MYLSREKLIKVLLVLFILGLCVAVVGIILNGVKQFRIGSQLSSMSQVSSLSHVLVRQQANLFALMLAKNTKTEELNAALDSFAQEDFILDANLYSPSGQLLAQNQNALELKKSLLNPDTQQIVEPVLVKSELAGFLRVTFDSQYIKNTNDKIGAMFRQLYGELIILVLVGGLFVSVVYYLFPRRKIVIHTPVRQTVESNQGQAQRFHRRRRLYNRK